MKRIISVVLALLLTAVLLTACVPENLTTDTPVVSDTAAAVQTNPSEEQTDPTTDSQPTEATDPADEVVFDKEACANALDAVMTHQPGTAGASLKCFAAAIAALDYADTLPADCAADLEAAVTEWYGALSEDDKVLFAMVFTEVDMCANDIIAGSIDLAEMADNAGVQPAKESYADCADSYALFSAAVYKLLEE
ncbi:MAG: hypothetical protein E7559_08870 [Ruminococcaceae bacterium]|nr:hypothetical protein [Oscillospiraceae bacterium]